MPDVAPIERIADLIGHRVDIALNCGCTSVKVARPEYLIERMGPEVTIAEAERRMICPKCRTRPRLQLGYQWGGGIRDRRPNPPPIPAWAKARLDGA